PPFFGLSVAGASEVVGLVATSDAGVPVLGPGVWPVPSLAGAAVVGLGLPLSSSSSPAFAPRPPVEAAVALVGAAATSPVAAEAAAPPVSPVAAGAPCSPPALPAAG